MPREFWPPGFPVDEWLPQAAPYIEIAIDYLWLWLWLLLLPFLAWDLLPAVEGLADKRLTVLPIKQHGLSVGAI